MNTTTRSEYFPDEREPQHHNGGNGNGKIFEVKRATDPDTLAILDARRNALKEPPWRLSKSVKAFFCEVLDRSLNPSSPGFICKGVVAASDSTLARVFSVSNRTIYTWKMQLAASLYVWLSKKFRTNMEPITVYNITALRPPTEAATQDDDGAAQHGKFRRGGDPRTDFSAKLGGRKPGQPSLPLPGSRQHPPGAEIVDLQGISGESRKKLRLSAEENFGSEPKKTSAESRSGLPVSPEADFHHKRDSEGVLEPKEVHTHIPVEKEAPKLPEFEPLDRKCAPRLRPKLGEDMIEWCKGKILALETARTAQPFAKERIAAYRARIKDVKAWAAGAL